jgi:hypothetical protein
MYLFDYLGVESDSKRGTFACLLLISLKMIIFQIIHINYDFFGKANTSVYEIFEIFMVSRICLI